MKKKLKNLAFAAKVNRDDITSGAADFGVPLEEHIQFMIEALLPMEKELLVKG